MREAPCVGEAPSDRTGREAISAKRRLRPRARLTGSNPVNSVQTRTKRLAVGRALHGRRKKLLAARGGGQGQAARGKASRQPPLTTAATPVPTLGPRTRQRHHPRMPRACPASPPAKQQTDGKPNFKHTNISTLSKTLTMRVLPTHPAEARAWLAAQHLRARQASARSPRSGGLAASRALEITSCPEITSFCLRLPGYPPCPCKYHSLAHKIHQAPKQSYSRTRRTLGDLRSTDGSTDAPQTRARTRVGPWAGRTRRATSRRGVCEGRLSPSSS